MSEVDIYFDYEVLSAEDANKARFQLLDDGEYDAVITKCTFERSVGKNNPMFDVTLDVYDSNGRVHIIRDFLIFIPTMIWKVIGCVEAIGLIKEYEEKKLQPRLLVSSPVKVFIKTQQGSLIPTEKLNGKPEGSRYPDKNSVAYYIKPNNSEENKKDSDDFKDDDVPF